VADDRYARQIRYAPIGAAGQARLRAATVAVVGCGALGSVAAEQLARAGVGRLRLIDRDFVEPSNLQRQSLYGEADAAASRPKAEAAAAAIGRINADVAVDPIVADVQASNIERLIDGVHLAIDGTDNFPTRHLLNEACCRHGVPWVHGACVGAYGVSFPILPGETACLRCVQGDLPPAGEGGTCDTVGVIAPAVHLVAAWQVAEALKILIGDIASVRRELWASDLWSGHIQRLRLARDPDCPACGGNASWPLLRAGDDPVVVLCGRDAVQVRLGAIDVAALARRLGGAVTVVHDQLLRFNADGRMATCFRDGRVIVQGVADGAAARAFCDRWIG
jgi:molybdopterin/thiamine biosynthesis adenylyltransferase